ncbi:probable L-gulonolactone oxidase 6 isoform X2 [Rhodamnia argentea]|uniref:L-gulonolactone oxidase n=2 Tax=Rhodamnia argentea TaxID=178133 RepID=A0A8B8PMB1_9MYRT|nr:probable L-gulonolactone oxidase 6 isoform X2 [Rhodamnia argentea]
MTPTSPCWSKGFKMGMPDSETVWASLHVIVIAATAMIMSVSATPPADPIRCTSSGCTITNSYGAFPDRTTCKAGAAAYPTSEEELAWVVGNATRSKRKMKVVTRFSHSIPKLVCPDGEEGLLVSTKYMNGIVRVDQEGMRMSVEGGVTLRQLIEEAAKAGMALPYTPYWWGLTVGGMLGTGAHGSSLWGKGSALHDHVEAMRIVSPGGPGDGYARIRTLDANTKSSHAEMNAVKVSLGVLGVISQVTLKLQPLFKRSLTYSIKGDSDLGEQAASFGNQHEFADIMWYPSQQKAVYRIDDRVSLDASGNGLYDSTPFRSTPSLTLALVRSTAEELQESVNDADGKCNTAKLISSTLQTGAYGLTNNGVIFTGYPVIGYQNRLQSSGTCLDSFQDGLITACPWDPRVKGEFFHQTTFSIGLSVVKSFIEDIQKLITLEPKALCGVELYNGILMRYVKASSPYLGKQEDAVDFDITYYRSKNPLSPRLYEDVLEEIEQMALIKYGALPHWGKNRNLAFDGAIKRYKSAQEFLKVKKMYDPMGLFSSEWTDQVLGLKEGPSIVRDGCALEGLCICSQDAHCAPNKGYYCKPGKVYGEARVCTRISSKTQ